MEQEIQFSLETKIGDGIRNECRNKISKKKSRWPPRKF